MVEKLLVKWSRSNCVPKRLMATLCPESAKPHTSTSFHWCVHGVWAGHVEIINKRWSEPLGFYTFIPDVFVRGKNKHFDGLVQDHSNSSTLAMALLQSCTKPWIYSGLCFLSTASVHVKMFSASEKRLCICNVFSHWLRPFLRDLRYQTDNGPRSFCGVYTHTYLKYKHRTQKFHFETWNIIALELQIYNIIQFNIHYIT